jgi:glycosyltransferase involved in cell wall biosynthesis
MMEGPIRILMVSTEYPPMQGGVGRYTFNLTKELRKIGLEVYVACNEKGGGQFFGLAPTNIDNSDVLLRIVKEIQPDIVHVQYEPGLYGLVLDPINPKKTNTNIESFYDKCKVPVVTTFHSAYTVKQWFSLGPTKTNRRNGNATKLMLYKVGDYWKRLLNYRSFHNLNKNKLRNGQSGIVFSYYMSKMIGGLAKGDIEIIYHGAQPAAFARMTKKEARAKFSLPQEGQIALALGFRTATKGWDILEKMKVPRGWTIVVSSSENHYIKYDLRLRVGNDSNIIILQNGFLSEFDLSILFYASDAIILPYKVSSASGVMFDGLAHGLPFVATDLEFFREFSAKGLGITVRRNPLAFSKGLVDLNSNYTGFRESVDIFKKKLSWNAVAIQHANLYKRKSRS